MINASPAAMCSSVSVLGQQKKLSSFGPKLLVPRRIADTQLDPTKHGDSASSSGIVLADDSLACSPCQSHTPSECLLRFRNFAMADANLVRPASSTRAPDEDSDHVGSGASTPPGGVSTPVPDLMDKRQPGLAHAYFAQVCHSLRAPFTPPNYPALPSPLSRSVTHGPSLNMDPSSTASAGAPPPTAPNSPKHSSVTSPAPPLLPHEQPDAALPSYPTPPLSSASSLHGPQLGEEESADAQTPIEKNTSAGPARLRSNTLPSSTVDTVVSRPHVSAHISSPAAQPTDIPDSLNASLAASSELEPLDSENKELTKDTKSTPPRTPRALSRNESAAAVDDAPTPAPSNPQISKIEKSSRSSSSSQPTIGVTKGQLSVNIVQGRGLKPSTAPYVVCIYQLNEDISGGAEVDAVDTKTQEKGGNQNENLAKGVAMRRMGSDSGKAMSIPGLGSRQTSQTDISKLKDDASDHLVTEPLWNHEAVLYVANHASSISQANDAAVMLLVTNLSWIFLCTTRRIKKLLSVMSVSAPTLRITTHPTKPGSN